jgi:hypothetical protein
MDERDGFSGDVEELERDLEEARAQDSFERYANAIARGLDPRELDVRSAALERVHKFKEGLSTAADELADALSPRLEGWPADHEESGCLAAYAEQSRQFAAAVSEARAFAYPNPL